MSVTMHDKTDAFAFLEGLNGRVLFLHGCNSRGVMGAGVARVVKQRWPAAFHAYLRHCATVPRPLILGTHQIVHMSPELSVVNAITQLDYGRRTMPGHAYADYDAVEKVVRELEGYVAYDYYVTVPVGCGLGGLCWSESDPDWSVKPSGFVQDIFEASSREWQVCRL